MKSDKKILLVYSIYQVLINQLVTDVREAIESNHIDFEHGIAYTLGMYCVYVGDYRGGKMLEIDRLLNFAVALNKDARLQELKEDLTFMFNVYPFEDNNFLQNVIKLENKAKRYQNSLMGDDLQLYGNIQAACRDLLPSTNNYTKIINEIINKYEDELNL